MKVKFILIVVLTINFNFGYSQINFEPEIGIYGTFNAFGTYNANKIPTDEFNIYDQERFNSKHYSNYGYIGLNGVLGGRISTPKTSILFQMGYLWFKNGIFYDLNNDIRNSGLLGLNVGFRIREDKRFKPTFLIQLYREIYTNYKNKSLDGESFLPTASQSKYLFSSEYMGHGSPMVLIYFTKSYQSTPFLGNLYIGCDIGLVKNLNLSILTGYNLSIINYKYVKFEYDDYVKTNYMALLGDAPIRRVLIHSWSFQLGLSYAFDVHKKKHPKTAMP